MRRNANHRSSESTLKQLAQSHLFLELDPARPVPLPQFGATGFAVARTLTRRGGGDRVEAISACTDEALRLTGIRSLRELTRDERAAWARWSALIVSIPGVQRWSLAERRALGRVFRAKGAPSETEFVRLFAAHAKLNRALLG